MPDGQELLHFDEKLRVKYGNILVGIDEAGRGAIGGPIVAAAVALPPDFYHGEINDSKRLCESKRMCALEQIENAALSFSVAILQPHDIDEHGLSWANRQVMLRSANQVVEQLGRNADIFVVDEAPRFPLDPHIMLAKADSLSLSVAAASIIAKTYRDNIMKELAKIYPQYDLINSKGYLTPAHKSAIKIHGMVKGLHRFSYSIKEKPQKWTVLCPAKL